MMRWSCTETAFLRCFRERGNKTRESQGWPSVGVPFVPVPNPRKRSSEDSLSPSPSQAKTKKIKKGRERRSRHVFFFDFSGSIDLVSFERIDARFLATSARVRSLACLPRTSRCTCHESTFLPPDRRHVRVSMLRKRNGGERRCGRVDRAGTLRDMDKQPRCNPRTKEWNGKMDKVSETNHERTMCAIQFAKRRMFGRYKTDVPWTTTKQDAKRRKKRTCHRLQRVEACAAEDGRVQFWITFVCNGFCERRKGISRPFAKDPCRAGRTNEHNVGRTSERNLGRDALEIRTAIVLL